MIFAYGVEIFFSLIILAILMSSVALKFSCLSLTKIKKRYGIIFGYYGQEQHCVVFWQETINSRALTKVWVFAQHLSKSFSL